MTASSPEKTDEPFRISYKYHRKEYGDWANRRTVAPAPVMALPQIDGELEEMTVPIWLGEPMVITFKGALTLPNGYSVEAPTAIHEKRSFAEFDATYAFKEGKLESERRLTTLKREVTKPDFKEYEKLCTTVLNDYSSSTPLFSGHEAGLNDQMREATIVGNALRSLPDSTNEEALRLENEAREAAMRNDPQTMLASLYRSVGADPKFVRGWLILGGMMMSQNQTAAGIEAFEKVTDTKYESGAEKLKTAGKALLKVNVGYTSPDGNAVRVVRRGTFLCSGVGNCEFMLPEVSPGNTVPVPVRVVN